ncbi:DegT/DnrJ/EryC1/StrS family aminotransferase [Reichenbachiella sp. MALMAid0571]|uniref:DegT/DnrJ/EryC1/StrS family aminotransferase n=1 Tax=Reichenbachiella sp. MALMAid0571 TaxID=3143939 RepID=UPI0032DF3D3F
MKKEKIYLSPPDLTGKEQLFIEEVLDSNWVAPLGSHLDLFEEKIAEHTGFKYSLAVNSGTSAIHLALLCHGVKKKDVVISSSLTFCGAVNPILYIGARPVFVDSSFDDWNIDVLLLEKSIKSSLKKPKAIVVTSLFGMPAKFDVIKSIGIKHGIPVIHDLAEAFGCQVNGQKPGEILDSAIVSFNGNKIITTSAGGALLTNNHEHYQRGLFLSTQAKEPGTGYIHKELGYNYRMSNVLAGLGLGQFTAINDKIEKKRKVFKYYKQQLENIKGIEFQEEKTGCFSDRWLTALFFNPKHFTTSPVSKIIENLAGENIESRYIWKPMHLQPLYKEYDCYSGEVSESLFENGLCLPSGTSLKPVDQNRIIEIVINTLKVFQ